MNELTLVIGNKNYSSWSLRPWLLLKHASIPFKEMRIPLYVGDWQAEMLKYSPSGKVPALRDGDLTVWDSLAICEYIAEQLPEHLLWPKDAQARAVARSVSAEMHSGFANLRQNMVMNCRKRYPGKGRAPGVQEDIDRITAIWNDCRARFGRGGDFLFGQFSIADAMFAPVTTRFITYDVPLDPVSAAYVKTVQAMPAMQEWYAAARDEAEVIEQYEY